MKAEDIQVAGNHYKDMAYQTARFGFDAGLESLGTQIAKYLTRDKGSHIENLEKAYHCICLDQQFDEEWKLEEGDYCLDIYYEHDDEPYLDKYFSQFPDGDKLKSVMRQYMKANYPQAKGLLRKYINSLAPKIEVGSKVMLKGKTKAFSGIKECYLTCLTVEHIHGNIVTLKELLSRVDIKDLELV